MQKNWLKYTDFTELKKITSRIYSNCSNDSSLFFMSFKFRYCSFCLIKKITINCTSVQLIFYLMVDFSNEKRRVVFLIGFTVFFKWAFLTKHGWFSWVGSNYINPGFR